MRAVRYRLAVEAQLKAAQDQIACQRDGKNGNKTVQQLEILKQDPVTNAARHAQSAFLGKRTHNECNSKGCQHRGVHGAGALFAHFKKSRSQHKQNAQPSQHGCEHRALGGAGIVGTAQRKALVQKARADKNAHCKSEQCR